MLDECRLNFYQKVATYLFYRQCKVLIRLIICGFLSVPANVLSLCVEVLSGLGLWYLDLINEECLFQIAKHRARQPE